MGLSTPKKERVELSSAALSEPSRKPEPTLTCCQEPMKPRRPSGAYSTM
jgi:hypothetical protein